MQRRSFLRNAACVGACASLFSPLRDVLAADVPVAGEVELKFDILASDPGSAATTSMQLRATPQAFAEMSEPLRVRAWFAGDDGLKAFDLASFGRQGASQRLRFQADPRRLVGFELGRGQHLDDCSPLSACRAVDGGGTAIGSGRYRLSLLRNGQAFAAVDLDVSVAAA